MSPAAAVFLSLVYSTVVGVVVYVLMRRNEARAGAVISLYNDAVSALNAYFSATTEGLSGGMQRLLEIAAAMSQGQAQLIAGLSQSLTQDHAARGLRLVEMLLPAAQEAAARARAGDDWLKQLEASLRVSSPAQAQCPSQVPTPYCETISLPVS